MYRNEALQEQLWEISVTAIKDWLSPEILAKYGPLEEQPTTGEQPMAIEEQPTTETQSKTVEATQCTDEQSSVEEQLRAKEQPTATEEA